MGKLISNERFEQARAEHERISPDDLEAGNRVVEISDKKEELAWKANRHYLLEWTKLPETTTDEDLITELEWYVTNLVDSGPHPKTVLEARLQELREGLVKWGGSQKHPK